MTFRRLFLVLALAAFAATPALAADTLVVDPNHSRAGFQIRHLLSTVHGRFGVFEGVIAMDRRQPAASSVTFTIDAASIDTDVADRDRHLRSPDFFDVEKYPTITFTSSAVRPTGKDRYDVTGTLTMRGVAKTITLPVTYLGEAKDPWGGTRAGFTTAVTLDRKDFGIVWNKALDAGGVLLGDEVKVVVDLQAVLKAPQPAARPAS